MITRLSGLLCATVGVLVVSLTCAMPEKMKEVFGAGDLDEEDVSYGEGYPSSVFLDDLTAPNARLVSWGQLMSVQRESIHT